MIRLEVEQLLGRLREENPWLGNLWSGPIFKCKLNV